MSNTASVIPKKERGFGRFLHGVEVVGNKLPDVVIIFVVLDLLVILLSWIGAIFGWSTTHPGTGKVVNVFNLLSPEGLQYMFCNMYQNFSAFAPFAIAMPLFLAVGIMDKSGLMEALFVGLGSKVNARLLTVIIVFVGIMSNLMSDAGFVILPPLAAMLFMSVGRNPILGICCAYTACGCGLAANLLIGISDARISATSQAAAQIIDPAMVVLPTANWYFIAAGAIVLTIVSALVTDKILEPRMPRTGDWSNEDSGVKRIDLASYHATPIQKKGMIAAGVSVLILVAIVLIGVLPAGGFFRNQDGKSIFGVQATQLGSIVTAIIFFIAVPGIVYGKVVGTVPDGKALGASMSKGVTDIAPFIVLCFFAGQFTAWFTKSNLGTIISVNGADFLRSIGLDGLPLMICLIILVSIINLFLPSANAKWALLAPIFVPMFMLLGFHPALTQMVYRVGDSIANSITPLMAYFALLLGLVKQYDKKAGLGTVMSLLIPYTLFYAIGWIGLFIVWFLLKLPFGPGGPIYL
jgi:aminobenzoyl-glutamate transport protein